MIIKGLSANEEPEQLLMELQQKHQNENLKFTNVTRLITSTSKRENINFPTFIVHITQDSLLSELTKIRTIYFQRIYWDNVKKEKVIQCHKCQRFGHVAVNCKLEYRCVKCNQTHTPGNCNLKRTEENTTTPYCANCKEIGHPASYKGCPIYREIKKRAEIRRNTKEKEKDYKDIDHQNSIRIEGVQYADLFKGQNTEDNRNNSKATKENISDNNQNELNNTNQSLIIFKTYMQENNKKIDKIMEILSNLTIDNKK